MSHDKIYHLKFEFTEFSINYQMLAYIQDVEIWNLQNFCDTTEYLV